MQLVSGKVEFNAYQVSSLWLLCQPKNFLAHPCTVYSLYACDTFMCIYTVLQSPLKMKLRRDSISAES